MITAQMTNSYEAVRLLSGYTTASGPPESTPESTLESIITPVAELILDGQRLSDLPGLAQMMDPANWVSPDTSPISVTPAVVTRISGGVEIASTLEVIREQGEDVRVQFTVSNGTLSRAVTVQYRVYPVGTVATPAILVRSVTLNSGTISIPFTDMFEPDTPNSNWVVPSDITLSGAPNGVTVGAGSLLINTDVLSAQDHTFFTVMASDTVSPPADTVRSSTKTIDLSATANVIEIVEEPAFIQTFAGGFALEDSNRPILLIASNYTGVTNPNIHARLMVDGVFVDFATHTWVEGNVGQIVVDVYDEGGVIGVDSPDATFTSNTMVAQELLTFSATSGAALSVTTNVNAPDDYPVNGAIINGRSLIDGLSVVNFKSVQMVMIQNALLEVVNENLIMSPPTVVAPDGSIVTITYDLINAADGNVIEADVTSTGDTITRDTAALSGLSVIWRAKFRAIGLNDLDVDTPTIAITGDEYVPKTFSTGAAGVLTAPNDENFSNVVFGGYLLGSGENQRLLTLSTGLASELNVLETGEINLSLRKGNQSEMVNVSVGTVSDVALTFVGFEFNSVTGTGTLQVGAETFALSTSNTGTTFKTGLITFFATQSSSEKYTENFADLVLDIDGSLTLDDLYNNGSPPDPGGFVADVILGGSMTTADFNSGNQLGTVTLTVPSGADTFSEVI